MNLQYVQGSSLFTNTNKVLKQYPYLTENITTDVIIIGGGVTGAILAYYFTRQNIDCVLLEKNRMAFGSTSITTTLLQYELDSNARKLEPYTPLEKSLKAYKLGLQALLEIDTFIKEHGNTCDYEKKDTLLYTSKKEEIAELEEEYNFRKANGLDVEFLTASSNPFSFDLKAGVYGIDGGAQLDPYKYTHQLLDASSKAGLLAFENTEAVKINYLDDGVEVETTYGYQVKGKIIIVATGYNTQLFTKRNFGVKTTTFNIATKPVASFEGWPGRVLIRDNSSTYHYLRTTADHRILAGGEDISFVPDIFDEDAALEKYKLLEARIKTMFPLIKGVTAEYQYCGAFASTQDNLGFLGKDPKNDKLWYCLGYGANGILFAILGGMMLSKLYLGSFDENLKLFKVNRFDG